MNGSTRKQIELPPVDEETLHRIVQKIVEAFHPLRIILFGSRARGDHAEDSDLDLFVKWKHKTLPQNDA